MLGGKPIRVLQWICTLHGLGYLVRACNNWGKYTPSSSLVAPLPAPPKLAMAPIPNNKSTVQPRPSGSPGTRIETEPTCSSYRALCPAITPVSIGIKSLNPVQTDDQQSEVTCFGPYIPLPAPSDTVESPVHGSPPESSKRVSGPSRDIERCS